LEYKKRIEGREIEAKLQELRFNPVVLPFSSEISLLCRLTKYSGQTVGADLSQPTADYEL